MRKSVWAIVFLFLISSSKIPPKKKSLKNLNISKKENIFIEDEKNFFLKKEIEYFPKKKLI